MTKVCTKCKEEKDVSEFGKDKKNKDGLCSQCKECIKYYRKQYYQENKEEVSQYQKQYYQENKEERNQYRKQYNQNHKEERSQYDKQYSQKYKEQRNKNERNRRKNDPIYRLRQNVSCSIWKKLKCFNSSKKDSCLKHLPYTIQQLYDHLEKQFNSNMSWSNYGSYWDIDHIIPQSLLPYDSMEHPNFQKCWALSNLRPLEHIENIRKGNKLIY